MMKMKYFVHWLYIPKQCKRPPSNIMIIQLQMYLLLEKIWKSQLQDISFPSIMLKYFFNGIPFHSNVSSLLKYSLQRENVNFKCNSHSPYKSGLLQTSLWFMKYASIFVQLYYVFSQCNWDRQNLPSEMSVHTTIKINYWYVTFTLGEENSIEHFYWSTL